MAHVTTMSAKAKCLNPKCQSKAKVRGLCPACYVRANEVIKKGLTTWKKLEAAKRVLPPQRQLKSTVEWLLGRAN
jgi:hypothetical protein